MSIKIKQGMNLLDAAVISSGSAEDLFAFAFLNKRGYTDDVAISETLETTGYSYLSSTIPTNDHITVKAVPVAAGQTIADMAIQQTGSIEGFFALAKLNGLSYSADLTPGQFLNYSITAFDKNIVKLYNDRGYKPASGAAIPGGQQPVQLEGIGYWSIQYNFIVS